MRLAFALLLALTACDTPVAQKRAPDAGATADAPRRPVAGASATVSPVPGASGSPSALPGKLLLTSGATLILPPGLTPVDSPGELPKEVKSARVFKLPGDARLMVNELDHGAEPCTTALDREWEKMQAAQGDTDPERLKFRQMKDIERLELEGKKGAYGASSHGTGQPGEVAGLATLIFCGGEDLVVAMLAAKQPEVPPSAKAVLLDLLRSHRPAAR
jgi:hypothetical protein